MDFAFTPEQESLRRSARKFLEAHSTSAQVRRAMESPDGFDREVWQAVARELGWTSLLVPEACGGAGGTAIDLAGIFEEAGRFLLCAPLFSTVCLATNALVLLGTEEQKQAWLPRIAEGTAMGTIAWQGDLAARRISGGFVLSGTRDFVAGGACADVVAVETRLNGDGPSVFLVPADSKGLAREPCTTLDRTRRQARLTFQEVFVPESARMRGDLTPVLDRARALLACEQVGGAERCLEMAVDYAKTRVQFNRPIGSFQAIKHKCAEMAVQVESARSAAYAAAWTASEAPEDLATAASIASAFCSQAYFECAAENIQIHGGIGFTWEHDAHLYFKRAKSDALLLGSPASQRRRIADSVVGP